MELEPFLRRDYDSTGLKKKLGIQPDEPVVGQVARLAPLKGYEYLIRAAQEILLHVPRARFLFVGDGPAAEAIREQARSAGVHNRIVFAGLVPASRVPEYIAAMDVVVHASLREGLPRVIPQAQLMSKPVIAYAIDGAPEALEDGITGYLVPPESVHELAQRTVELLLNPQKARVMGERGCERCRGMFSTELMVQKIDLLYQELLSKQDTEREFQVFQEEQ